MKLGEVVKSISNSKIGKFIGKNNHTIMSVMAVGGLFGSVVLTYTATPNVKEIIKKGKDRIKEVDDSDEFTDEEKKVAKKQITKETAKELVPVAGPAIGCTIATAGLIIGSDVISTNKINNLAHIATLSEIAYKELSDKQISLLGEEKANEIKEAVAKDGLEELSNGNFGDDGILQARGGNILFYDSMIGRLFRSDPETIREVSNRLNAKITGGSEPWISLNEFYLDLELPSL